MTPKVAPRTMPGVLELLPPEQITFQRMLDTIRRVFETYAFVPIETPAIELTDVLLTKSGGETERQVYFVQSTGALDQDAEPDLALRFDLTVPLARYVAEHEHDLAFPFRRYQIQRVYRGESPQRGRFREFYQCDIDVVGRERLSLRYDAEMPAVIHETFRRLGIGPFTIRLNNRKLMRGLLASVGIDGEAPQTAVMREIDKLERRGAESVREGLSRLGIGTATVDRLLEVAAMRASGIEAAVETLESLGPGSPLLETGREELRTVITTMDALGVPGDGFALDLSVSRGLDYYTGTVYETTLDEHPAVGSICSGGRYDDLAGHYTDSDLPGVGISIGVTRLFWQLRELGLVGASPSTVRVYVTLMEDPLLDDALGLATELRAAGINTEVAMEPDRLGKQLRYVDRAGIRFALIAGSDERARGTVAVKDLVAQTQQEVARDEVVGHLLSTIEE